MSRSQGILDVGKGEFFLKKTDFSLKENWLLYGKQENIDVIINDH